MSGIRLERSFLPIGQGAFYCERFFDGDGRRLFTAIYDCGVLPFCKKRVTDLITDNFERGETIDAVFISHFDADHIDGIETLMTWCRVQKFFLPVIDDAEMELIFSAARTVFQKRFIRKPEEEVAKYGTRVYKISQAWRDDGYHEEGERVVDEPRTFNIDELGDGVANIPSGSNLCQVIGENGDDEVCWTYRPFNLPLSNNVITELRSIVKAIQDDGRLSHGEKTKEYKAAYRRFLESLNDHSMTLYSGTTTDYICRERYSWGALTSNILQRHRYRCHGYCQCGCGRSHERSAAQSGCLYTGDYNASLNLTALYDAYSDVWNRIGCLQIPHHGSSKSFNNGLVVGNGSNVWYVVSAGISNKYGHPNEEVIMKIDLMSPDSGLVLVTECPCSRFNQVIYVNPKI